MKKLILLRHAKSSWDDPTMEDHDRILNKRGQRGAAAMGDWLRAEGHLPDEVLCSTAARTVETFDRLGLDCELRLIDGLYLASPDAMLRHLGKASADTVMLLGHNPGMGALADILAKTPPDHPRFRDYPTAACTVLRFDNADWTRVPARQGTVLGFAIPADLETG